MTSEQMAFMRGLGGCGSVSEKLFHECLDEIESLQRELQSIDEAFARRHALADRKTRAERAAAACDAAAGLERQYRECQQLLAHKNETANTFMAQVKKLQAQLRDVQMGDVRQFFANEASRITVEFAVKMAKITGESKNEFKNMHYKNGREAKVGDWVVGISHNSQHQPVCGLVMELMPKQGPCNIRIHVWPDEYFTEEGNPVMIPAERSHGRDDYGDAKEFILASDGLRMVGAIHTHGDWKNGGV